MAVLNMRQSSAPVTEPRCAPTPTRRRVNWSMTTSTQKLRSTIDSHRKRSTLHRLSVICPMNDNHEGPVPPRGGAITFRQHAVYDVFVDINLERVRDDARNPRTAEPRIARLELDDGLDECVARPLRSGLLRARARREQSAVHEIGRASCRER